MQCVEANMDNRRMPYQTRPANCIRRRRCCVKGRLAVARSSRTCHASNFESFYWEDVWPPVDSLGQAYFHNARCYLRAEHSSFPFLVSSNTTSSICPFLLGMPLSSGLSGALRSLVDSRCAGSHSTPRCAGSHSKPHYAFSLFHLGSVQLSCCIDRRRT